MLLSGAALAEKKLERITFAWPSAINSGIGPLNFADELGFLREEGLELEVIVLSGAGSVIPQLMSGKVLSAYIAIEPLVISRQPGKPNFPVKFVYNYQRKTIWEISVPEASPIKSVKDLAGKIVGVGGLQWGNIAMTKAIFERSGLKADSVSLVAVGTGVPAFEAIKRGQVDALNLYDTMNTQLDLMGFKMRRLTLPPELGEISSHGIPFSDKVIKERPDLVEKFGRALARGTVACAANPENCVRAYWKRYPALKPAIDEKVAMEREVALVKDRIEKLTFFRKGEPRRFGEWSEKDWIGTIDGLKVGGQIETNAKIDISTLYTNKFIEQFNKFDAAEAERKANAYVP